jgi:biopolymer transport protein ExbB
MKCSYSRLLVFAVLFGLIGLADQAMAQGLTDENVQRMTWKQVMQAGGWLMYVLGLLSIGVGAMVIYLFAVLRQSQITPELQTHQIIDTLSAGSMDAARRVCDERPSPIASVTLSALDFIKKVPNADAGMIKDSMESEGGRQSEAIQGQTQYLLDIAVIAPMVGLLGTVFGMLTAFSSVALDIAKAKPILLAQGVAQALITTVAGLLIGIPAMAFYAYFRRKAATLVSTLEKTSSDILATLISKRTR